MQWVRTVKALPYTSCLPFATMLCGEPHSIVARVSGTTSPQLGPCSFDLSFYSSVSMTHQLFTPIQASLGRGGFRPLLVTATCCAP
mmetsp:Transcript_84482/g.148217  ORF Transcript_84482/g.148217 Transcript_84482/m.148217 type:complete len:86 (+) Transcript_84482:54-311(+)